MSSRVVFSPDAEADLLELFAYIAERASPDRALSYVERVEAACLSLSDYPHRGTRLDHLRPGLRTIGFERRATIAFHVLSGTVTIDRILYGGRDLDAAFTEVS